MTERRCGTCKWWKLEPDTLNLATCVRPIPEWVLVHSDPYRKTRRDQGTTCPTWEERQS